MDNTVTDVTTDTNIQNEPILCDICKKKFHKKNDEKYCKKCLDVFKFDKTDLTNTQILAIAYTKKKSKVYSKNISRSN
jgi:hypothetical protein